jgi:hypothetical protein
MCDLHARSTTVSQEPNYIHVHERHFLHIDYKLRAAFKKLLLQFLQMLRLKVANQIDRHPSALRAFLDPHCHSSSNCGRFDAMQPASQNHLLNGGKLRREKVLKVQES